MLSLREARERQESLDKDDVKAGSWQLGSVGPTRGKGGSVDGGTASGLKEGGPESGELVKP
jgi:hypothetical protein